MDLKSIYIPYTPHIISYLLESMPSFVLATPDPQQPPETYDMIPHHSNFFHIIAMIFLRAIRGREGGIWQNFDIIIKGDRIPLLELEKYSPIISGRKT